VKRLSAVDGKARQRQTICGQFKLPILLTLIVALPLLIANLAAVDAEAAR
jgi:hypothetical protein